VVKEPPTPKKKKGLTPKKLLRAGKSPGRLLDNLSSSTTVRTSSFVLNGSLSIKMNTTNKGVFSFEKVNDLWSKCRRCCNSFDQYNNWLQHLQPVVVLISHSTFIYTLSRVYRPIRLLSLLEHCSVSLE